MWKTAVITLFLALWARTQAPAAPVVWNPTVHGVHIHTALPAFADTVTLLIPFDAAANELLTPMFAWRKVADADSHELQISTDADFSTVERSLTGLIDTLHVLSGDLNTT